MKHNILTSISASLLTLTLSLMLSSCNLSKDSSGAGDQDRAVADRAQKLRTEYSEVSGLYEGTFSTTSGNYTASFNLYSIELDDGLDSNGRTKTKPALKATFVIDESVDDFSELTVSFDRDSGDVTMAADKSAAASSVARKAISVRGQIRAGQLFAEVIKEGGTYGHLNLKFKDQKATALSDQERKDRIIKIYQKIAGSYRLTIVTPTITETDDLYLRINTSTNPPSLVAECRSSFGGFEAMTTSFDSMAKPAMVTVSSNPSNTSPGRCYFSSFSGSLTSEGLAGLIEVRTSPAPIPVVLKSVSPK